MKPDAELGLLSKESESEQAVSTSMTTTTAMSSVLPGCVPTELGILSVFRTDTDV